MELIYTHMFDAGLVGLAAGRLAGIPVVHMRHHLEEHSLLNRPAHVELDRFMARHADLVVVPSNASRDYLAHRERIASDKIRVVHHGYAFDAMRKSADGGRRIRRELGLGETFVIGYVSRFIPYKDHESLIRSAAQLRDRLPDLRLLLVGGGDHGDIRARIEELGLGDRVVFAGHRDDVMACISAMDVMVHPSRTESFGLAVLEGLAAEVPVVACRVGGVIEIVKNGETGVLIPPGDVAAMAGAVSRLHDDPGLRRSMGRAGREDVVSRFDVERMLDGHVEVCRAAVDHKGAGRS